ncbi:carbon-nitrogen hydrolase family protein [Pseudomonas sp. nanlin1]|uniref:carbon-nitrogen hydrolase family protein n=1 Tax=Pseudomonas sp. nanlin1 TaxID=3040605 RepID=UPI00388E45B4
MAKIKIATVAMEATYDKAYNLEKMLAHLQLAAAEGADLVVFPEQVLQGYLSNTTELDFANVAHQFAAAEPVPSGPSVRRMLSEAQALGVHVIFGMTECTRADVLFNTCVLGGPAGYIGHYRKVHQPGDEKHVYYPGDGFPVFDTALGRIGMLICYDKVFPESTRELALKGAQILVMPTAWAFAGETADISADAMLDTYTLFGRVRALENQCWMVEANLYGHHGKLHYHGHSRIIDPNGMIVADTGYACAIAYADVDVLGAIVQARSVDYIGYNFLKDYQPMQVPALPGIASAFHAQLSAE